MPKLHRLRGVAAACLVIALVGACSDNPHPKAISSSTPTPSASASPGGPPTLPPAAQGTSKQAAIAFVRYWISSLNYASTSGDTRPLRSTSAHCAACNAIRDLIERVYRKGGSIDTAGWSAVSAQALQTTPRQVRVVVDSAPQTFRVPGKTTQHFKGGKSLKTFTLKPDHGTWRVTYLDQS